LNDGGPVALCGLSYAGILALSNGRFRALRAKKIIHWKEWEKRGSFATILTKRSRVSRVNVPLIGLKQFCPVLDVKPPGYVDISGLTTRYGKTTDGILGFVHIVSIRL
jgi:hypothetical protein